MYLAAICLFYMDLDFGYNSASDGFEGKIYPRLPVVLSLYCHMKKNNKQYGNCCPYSTVFFNDKEPVFSDSYPDVPPDAAKPTTHGRKSSRQNDRSLVSNHDMDHHGARGVNIPSVVATNGKYVIGSCTHTHS